MLFGRALRGYAEARDLSYSRIELRATCPWEKARFAARTLAAERGQPRTALFFDHLGPARIQAFVPGVLRQPYAVFLHGIEVWGPLRPTAAAALRQADLLLSNSDHTQRRAREFTPDLPVVRVVGLALSGDRPSGVADPEVLTRAQGDYFLVVGRMHPAERYKGHDLVLTAMCGLRRGGISARCVFVGEGADRPRLEARADDLGVGDLVLFTGTVSDATREALYARCRAMVLPSTGEGFGLVYLEAMRAGRPCVAARGGAAEEIVTHEVTGFLVDPTGPAGLQGALARLARDPALGAALGAAGRRHWQEHFTEDRFRSRLDPELDSLFAHATRP
jgi:phosphatidylinositol alpha-1,6-mannosyltransferase